jgi:hypothetical protein
MMHGPVPDRPKIGVLVPPRMPAGQLVGYAQKAEQLGFPEVWVVEDCFLHGAFTQAATIGALRRLLTGQRVDFGGRYVDDDPAVTSPG